MEAKANICNCTITNAGKCVNCGQQVWAIHDRPCGECKHFKTVIGGSICREHLMNVSPDMNVTYDLREGSSGLCFEEGSA